MEHLSVSTEGTAAQPSIDVNLHLEAPCTQRGATQETQRSSPSDGDRVKQQQKSRSSCAEHPQTPPATAEQ